MSAWLDQNKEVLDKVAADINLHDVADTGRPGLTVESVLRCAQHAKVEQGKMLRIESAVTAAPIHEPSDSTRLWDSVWVLVRLLHRAEDLAQRLPKFIDEIYNRR